MNFFDPQNPAYAAEHAEFERLSATLRPGSRAFVGAPHRLFPRESVVLAGAGGPGAGLYRALTTCRGDWHLERACYLVKKFNDAQRFA